MKKFFLSMCAALMLSAIAAIGAAQTNPQAGMGPTPTYLKAETAEQRKTRLGTAEDPGLDPDPDKHFYRFGKSFHIEKTLRRYAVWDQPEGFVRPMGNTPAEFELYQLNNEFIWAWIPDLPPPTPIEQNTEPPADKYDDRTYAFLKDVRSQFTRMMPEASGKTVHFRESSSGLPTGGSWRNSLAVADMNEDGCPDLITPPERKGSNIPVIFLGDCKGNWKYWAEAKFPQALDYGSVATADFNKDGHVDLVFAVHLRGLFVFLGDGKGHFTDASEGLPRDFPTRRVVVADLDHDGYPDIAAASEGPSQQQPEGFAPLRGYLNRKKGRSWTGVAISALDAKLGGDWLSTGNFNEDAYPDFVASSVIYGSMDVAFVSTKPKMWKKVDSNGTLLPSLSYYLASTAGHFSSKTHDDAIISYVRYWPADVNTSRVPRPELYEVSSIDRLVFSKDEVRRESVARFEGHGGVSGLASADFDGDKNLDLVYIVENPRAIGILLGDGHGGFRTAAIDGITMATHRIYDVKVADVNNDKRPDIIVMYEAEGPRTVTDRGGSIRVYLNEGTDRVPPPAAAQ